MANIRFAILAATLNCPRNSAEWMTAFARPACNIQCPESRRNGKLGVRLAHCLPVSPLRFASGSRQNISIGVEFELVSQLSVLKSLHDARDHEDNGTAALRIDDEMRPVPSKPAIASRIWASRN